MTRAYVWMTRACDRNPDVMGSDAANLLLNQPPAALSDPAPMNTRLAAAYSFGRSSRLDGLESSRFMKYSLRSLHLWTFRAHSKLKNITPGMGLFTDRMHVLQKGEQFFDIADLTDGGSVHIYKSRKQVPLRALERSLALPRGEVLAPHKSARLRDLPEAMIIQQKQKAIANVAVNVLLYEHEMMRHGRYIICTTIKEQVGPGEELIAAIHFHDGRDDNPAKTTPTVQAALLRTTPKYSMYRKRTVWKPALGLQVRVKWDDGKVYHGVVKRHVKDNIIISFPNFKPPDDEWKCSRRQFFAVVTIVGASTGADAH